MYSHVTAGSAYISKFCIKRAICLASTASSSFHCVHFGSARKPILWQTMCADKQVMSPVWKTGLRFQFSNHQKLKILPKIAKTTKTLVPGIKLCLHAHIFHILTDLSMANSEDQTAKFDSGTGTLKLVTNFVSSTFSFVFDFSAQTFQMCVTVRKSKTITSGTAGVCFFFLNSTELCAKFCLKCWFESNQYFCMITKSGWF